VVDHLRPETVGGRRPDTHRDQRTSRPQLHPRRSNRSCLPNALSDLTNFPGLDPTKARRLHKIADAGAELQADALKSRGPEDAFIYAQTLEGIGPFYASLIVLRATGFADAPLRIPEPRTLNYAAELYNAQRLSLERLTQLAETWRPFRTWSTVLIRIAAAHAKAQQHVTSSKARPPHDIQ